MLTLTPSLRAGNANCLQREIRRLFSEMMKLPALFAPPHTRSFATLAPLGAAFVLCLGCESSGAADAPRPTATVKEHPAFALPKTSDMLADPEPSAARVNDARPPRLPREKKDWQPNCKIQKGCSPEAKEIPICEAHALERPWVDVVSEGDAVLGKEVEVSGTLGLSLLKKTGSGACAPGACCHTLEMQLVLVGEPTGSLPLRGLTCSGDDSALCCSVPADGQAVIARGRLQKAATGGSKWQLESPTLCLIDHTPRH